MMLKFFAREGIGALLFFWLAGAPCAAAEPGPPPAHPQLLEPSRAPTAAKILNQVALAYDPQMSPAERERDRPELAR